MPPLHIVGADGRPLFTEDLPLRSDPGLLFKSYVGGEIALVGRPGPVTDRAGLKVGDEVVVPGLFGDEVMKVVAFKGDLWVQSVNHVGRLEYSRDDRRCWTCGGLFNVAALRQTEGTRR